MTLVTSPSTRSGALAVAAILSAGVVLGLAALLRPRRVIVAGRSMEPTFVAGDRLLVARTSPPKAGDLVALRDPRDRSRLIVKRVAAVRRGEVIVRGDNADASVDSRVFGPVPNGEILGKVVRRYAPASRAGPVGRGSVEHAKKLLKTRRGTIPP